MSEYKLRLVTKDLFVHYDDILYHHPFDSDIPMTDSNHLRWMCDQGIEHHMDWPVDKLNRWIGFIQGVMIMKKITTVELERNYTRPLFEEVYNASIPPKNI